MSDDLRQAIRAEIARAGVLRPGLSTPLEAGGPATPAALARVTTSAWLADYQASSATLPANDDPAWAEYTAGAATQAVTASVLTITTAATTDSLFNYVTLSGLDAASGSYIEARLQVQSDAAGTNGGACLAVFDGSYLSVVWLRTDGLNVDGSADVPVTLSDAPHRVAMHVEGTTVRAYVDGVLMQTGAPCAATTLEAAAFGSWIDPTP